MTSRRTFLKTTGLAGAGWLTLGRLGEAQPAADDLWDAAATILRRIVPPTFPNRRFDITKFGAAAGSDATRAFRDAIAACHAAGGGQVVVPAGRFETGPIVLTSNVNLHVSAGATIAFSRDPSAYLPVVFTRYEGVELMNYPPFISALDAENVAITGEGTLDGQADAEHWWAWRTRAVAAGGPRSQLFDMAARGVPAAERVFGADRFMRPVFVQPYRCTNVLIEGVTIV